MLHTMLVKAIVMYACIYRKSHYDIIFLINRQLANYMHSACTAIAILQIIMTNSEYLPLQL